MLKNYTYATHISADWVYLRLIPLLEIRGTQVSSSKQVKIKIKRGKSPIVLIRIICAPKII